MGSTVQTHREATTRWQESGLAKRLPNVNPLGTTALELIRLTDQHKAKEMAWVEARREAAVRSTADRLAQRSTLASHEAALCIHFVEQVVRARQDDLEAPTPDIIKTLKSDFARAVDEDYPAEEKPDLLSSLGKLCKIAARDDHLFIDPPLHTQHTQAA